MRKSISIGFAGAALLEIGHSGTLPRDGARDVGSPKRGAMNIQRRQFQHLAKGAGTLMLFCSWRNDASLEEPSRSRAVVRDSSQRQRAGLSECPDGRELHAQLLLPTFGE